MRPEQSMSGRAAAGRKERSTEALWQDEANANTVNERNILSSELF